jgi:DNA polymerase
VDARARLRRFLEQRREAGVRELVLDELTVEEAMRLLGAAGASRPGAGSREAEADDPAAGTDWRAALRAAGADPASERRPAPPPTGVAPPSAAGDLRPERATSVTPPSEPMSRGPFGKEHVRPSGGGEETHATLALDQVPAGLVVGVASHELFGGPGSGYASLDEIAAAVAGCTRCPLYRDATNPVPGEGDPHAGLVCVGEAPGAVEDQTGRPFVGPAGQLLDKILGAIQLSREQVFICNVLKHRPPNNRNPLPDEVQACSPYLVRQIELIRPRVIVAFGTFAAQTLLNTRDAIGKLRGKIHRYYGVPLVVTYHPAALLRNPGWKRPTWDDVKLARRLLDRAVGS